MIGDVHAAELFRRFPSYYAALITKLKAWFADNFVVHDDGRVPLMELKTHLRNVLSSTLRHYVDHTRGRLESCDDPASAFAPAREAASLDELCTRIECFFTGDIRLPYPVHIKTAETTTMTRDELIEMGVLIVADARLVQDSRLTYHLRADGVLWQDAWLISAQVS
jgi:hypothetical protein